jgi:GDP-D-mannose dehydratase
MYKLLNMGTPGDYVFGTGINTSIEEFLTMSAKFCGVSLVRASTVVDGVFNFIDRESGKTIVTSDVNKYGANRFSYGAASATKLMSAIGNPEVTKIQDLARLMVESEIARAGR